MPVYLANWATQIQATRLSPIENVLRSPLYPSIQHYGLNNQVGTIKIWIEKVINPSQCRRP